MSPRPLLHRALSLQAVACDLLLVTAASGCRTASFEATRPFEDQLAIVSPQDEPEGRFHGARLSPGFGILYINGYTDERVTNEACGGYLGDRPEHVIELDYPMSLKLVLQSGASDELVLAVSGPDGAMTCWEPSAANQNVSLTTQYGPGSYSVWVGPRVPMTSSAYRLVLSE